MTHANDTYEPGSTFKIVTSVVGLSEGVVDNETEFDCNSGYEVAGRFIKCWKSPLSHGHETFVEGVMNSCNAEIELGRLRWYINKVS